MGTARGRAREAVDLAEQTAAELRSATPPFWFAGEDPEAAAKIYDRRAQEARAMLALVPISS